MPKYKFQCGVCNAETMAFRTFAGRDVTEICVRCLIQDRGSNPMKRIFSADFQIIAEREADKRENKLYDILTKGGGEKDKLELYRQDMARLEKSQEGVKEQPKEFTAQDILDSGIIEANRSGRVGIENWRKQNIPEKTYAEGETIA